MAEDPESNPFRAATTDDEASPPRPPSRAFSVLAVVAGVAVDWGLTKLTVPRYIEWVELTRGARGIDELLTPGAPLQLIWSGIGWGCSVVGGVVTGWIARRRELLHGLGNFTLTVLLLRIMAVRDHVPMQLDWQFLKVHAGNLIAILLGAGIVWMARQLLAPREAR